MATSIKRHTQWYSLIILRKIILSLRQGYSRTTRIIIIIIIIIIGEPMGLIMSS